jgi:hypothetical protein
MPQIFVTADGPNDHGEAVMWRERITPADLNSSHFKTQLVERLGWAVADADAAGAARTSRHAHPIDTAQRTEERASASRVTTAS